MFLLTIKYCALGIGFISSRHNSAAYTNTMDTMDQPARARIPRGAHMCVRCPLPYSYNAKYIDMYIVDGYAVCGACLVAEKEATGSFEDSGVAANDCE